MTDLRAPDPTLDALDGGEPLLLDTADELPVAHLPGPGEDAECGHVLGQYDCLWLIAEFSRWFAVPCRDCFPDAPPHGVYVGDCGLTGCDGLDHEPGEYPPLAWQVGGDTP